MPIVVFIAALSRFQRMRTVCQVVGLGVERLQENQRHRDVVLGVGGLGECTGANAAARVDDDPALLATRTWNYSRSKDDRLGHIGKIFLIHDQPILQPAAERARLRYRLVDSFVHLIKEFPDSDGVIGSVAGEQVTQALQSARGWLGGPVQLAHGVE